MGLDFDRGSAHWSYSGFMEFRRYLAIEAGIDLKEMKSFGGCLSWDTVDDPIKFFLDHSDCEGELTSEECSIIYPRLFEILDCWYNRVDEDDPRSIHISRGFELVEAMKMCVEDGQPLVFC